MALVMESDEVTLEQPTQKPYKIAIVGPEEKKWGIFEDIKEKAKDLIRISLIQERAFHGDNLVVVSGHCPKGGVDIWVEEIADGLGIRKEIYPAETEGWEDEYIDYGGKKKGYKSRNMDIVESCDVLYCIVPSDSDKYCYHCKILGHPANGGCWAKKYADGIGKPTHLVLIEQ